MTATATSSRFWQKVDQSAGPGGCWLWRGSLINTGYGAFRYRGRSALAHRVVCELVGRPVPADMTVDHLCRVPACVNPAHLEIVTKRINTLRGTAPTAVNAAKTACVRGHVFDEANTITTKHGRECRACRQRRESQRPRRDRRDYLRLYRQRSLVTVGVEVPLMPTCQAKGKAAKKR